MLGSFALLVLLLLVIILLLATNQLDSGQASKEPAAESKGVEEPPEPTPADESLKNEQAIAILLLAAVIVVLTLWLSLSAVL